MTTYCRQQYTRSIRCDVTVVHVKNGWTIGVARKRKVSGRMRYEKIGLSHDGLLLHYTTPGKAAAKLQALQDEGYHIPDKTIAELESEWTPA